MGMMNFRVRDELKEQFEKAVALADLSSSQVLRDFMRKYVESARDNREYETWLVEKVGLGLSQARDGRTVPPSCSCVYPACSRSLRTRLATASLR